MNKKQLFLTSIGMVINLQSVLNPLIFYTPYNSVIQIVQTNTLQQTVAAVASAIPSPTPATSVVTASPTTTASEKPISLSTTSPIGQNIQSAGTYVLSSSITYTGTSASTYAILISQSNVVFDLNGQTLAFTGNLSTQNSVSGIKIAPGVTNITIKNGTISNFPGTGISALGLPETPCHHITLESLKIVSCYHGVTLSNTHNVLVSNCLFAGNTGPRENIYGFAMEQSTGVSLQNCISQNNRNQIGNCYGFIVRESQAISLYNCTGQNNQGYKKAAGICFLNMSAGNYIESCRCNGNSSPAGNAFGILLEQSIKTFVQNSTAVSNTAIAPFWGYGIGLLGSTLSFIKHNSVDCNDYGIYDDEQVNQHTNIFTQNIAYHNKIADYLRPFSSPLNFLSLNQEHLQGMLLAGALANISIRITT